MLKIEVIDKVYNVELAVTDEEKEKGLQGVDELGLREGMLFVYDKPQEVSFWMDDTFIYLDIIFIDEYWEVISVAVGAPYDKTYMSEKNVKYVLELNANSGVKAGDDVDLTEVEDYLEEFVYEDEDSEEHHEEEEEEEDDKEESTQFRREAIKEDSEEEDKTENHTMVVLDEKGNTQMELIGGERIFSREHTRKLIFLAKKAAKSKDKADYRKLGKTMFQFIEKQDTQKQEFVHLEK